MKAPWIALFLAAFMIGSFGETASAQSRSAGIFWGQKSAQREASRWTLEEWLAQKDRNAMMDLWLAFNQSSPYEFSLTLANQSYRKSDNDGAGTTTTKTYYDYRAQVQAYASIFGLALEYENNTPEDIQDTTGIFQLRILGDSIQNTHLTLMYGLRTRSYAYLNPSEKVSQTFAGAELQMYLAKYFGIRGEYRQYLAANNETLGDLSSSQTEAGIFIDFGPVRVFGDWYQEKDNRKNTTTLIENKIERTGIKSGLKFFF